MASSLPSILDLDSSQLSHWLVEQGHAKFRGKQILHWIYQRRAQSFHEMTNLPSDLRSQLDEHFQLFSARIAEQKDASDGTQKLLLALADCDPANPTSQVECVLLREENRRSVCLSSQVGCAMGCVFCASGLDGVERNLTRGEILEQLLRLQLLLPADERISHIVMMGMGEPLANVSNVCSALEVAKSAQGLGISPRRITISTVGLPKGIDKLAAMDAPFHLAISLHAPNDALRDELVPVNSKVGIPAILESADRYFERTGRRITFEYVLLKDINDSREHALQLAKLLSGRNALLNVIPYNPVAGLPYETPESDVVFEFRSTLLNGGVNVMFRQRKGDKIDAACGQLRRLKSTIPVVKLSQ